jgi:hypothetical protein
MTGWAADRHVTPRVIAYLAEHLADVPAKHRPTIGNAGSVLRALCTWARREPGADNPGHWLATDTVGQLHAATGIAPGTIRDCLGALERVGLTVTLSNGGGKGEHARGAVRRLILDPVDHSGTPRAHPAEFRPILRGPEPADVKRVLRGISTDTPRAQTDTPRAQARDTALAACTTYPRAGKAGGASTATTVDLSGLKPTDVLRCPNLPARKNAWCRHTCELCHGMGHIHAEQLGVT